MSNEIAKTIWAQIPHNTKQCLGAEKIQFNDDRTGERDRWHVRFRCNLSEDGMFISFHDDGSKPDHFITVWLDEGRDTYVVDRFRRVKGLGAVHQAHAEDVYAEDFDAVLMRMSDSAPDYNLMLEHIGL